MGKGRLSEKYDVEKHVSLVVPQDAGLYKGYAGENSVCYGDGWFYHQQAARNAWYKYHDGDTLITITTKEKGKYPYVLVRPRGKSAPEKTFILAKKLSDSTGKAVIVKKIDEAQKSDYLDLGFEDYREGDGWNQNHKYDDDTHPELIIDLRKMASMGEPGHHDLRYYVKRFKKQHSLKAVEYDAHKHFIDASIALKNWAASYLERHPEEDMESLIKSHMPYIERNPDGERGKDFFAYLYYVENEPVAFTLAAKISDAAVGMYASVASTKYVGLPETVAFETFRKAHEAGYSYANFGGCEVSELNHFHKRFNPEMRHKCTHVVLYPHLHHSNPKLFD